MRLKELPLPPVKSLASAALGTGTQAREHFFEIAENFFGMGLR